MKAMSYAELLDKIDFINSLYDSVRIVDPVEKTVLTDGKTFDFSTLPNDMENSTCHDMWNSGAVCTNCISMRAYNEGESFIKIEYDGENPYIVTALPVILENRTVVLELLTIVDKPEIIGDFSNSTESEIRRMLEERNMELVTDPLTGIFNRRYINERLPHDMLASGLSGEPLTLAMADIDYFKKVNDFHGHLAGDFILERFADLMKKSLRPAKDWVARFGGEEFLIVMNKTDSDAAFEIIEGLRKAIEDEDNVYQGKDIKITCSFGMHTLSDDEIDVETLIQRADRNLYAAKEAGRNKVVRN
ncbi:MAG TPA: GGDEF domain-containing protein [Clostridia bacterium]|nr:GGDEF domain-containing protein [Clostridia bacterium]